MREKEIFASLFAVIAIWISNFQLKRKKKTVSSSLLLIQLPKSDSNTRRCFCAKLEELSIYLFGKCISQRKHKSGGFRSKCMRFHFKLQTVSKKEERLQVLSSSVFSTYSAHDNHRKTFSQTKLKICFCTRRNINCDWRENSSSFSRCSKQKTTKDIEYWFMQFIMSKRS